MVEVTARKIRTWTRDGLLPAPARAALPGHSRAGVPYRYPEPAPSAVKWLGRHRRYIQGVQATKFWMRVEGFSYVELDVNTFLRDRAASVWEQARAKVPSLPEIDRARSISEDLQERLLDEIDVGITAPYLDHDLLTDKTAAEVTIGGAAIGIIPSRYLEGEPARTGADDDGRYKPYADYLLEEGEKRYADAAKATLPQIMAVANVAATYDAASRGAVDEGLLRTTWRHAKERSADGDVLRAWGYDPLVLALMSLSMERIVLPRVREFLPDFLWIIERVAEDLETPSDLAAKLRANITVTRKVLGIAPPGSDVGPES